MVVVHGKKVGASLTILCLLISIVQPACKVNYYSLKILTVVIIMTGQVVPLEARKRLVGDTVLSGTVKSFYMRGRGSTGRGGPFAGKVKVRRVFRGDSSLEVGAYSSEPTYYDDNAPMKTLQKLISLFTQGISFNCSQMSGPHCSS